MLGLRRNKQPTDAPAIRVLGREKVYKMGAEKAREQARALVDQAVAHLSSHGKEADTLRALARFIVERDR